MNKNELRRRAEEIHLQKRTDTASLSQLEIDKLIHELEVHQIELEIQNEELRITQQKLQQTTNEYTELYDLAPVGYCTFDPHGVVQKVNYTLSVMLQRQKKHIMYKPMVLFIDPEYHQRFYQHRHTAIENLGQTSCELKLKTPQGQTMVKMTSYALRDDDSNVLFIRSSVTNISDLKQTELDLLRHRETIRALLNATTDILVLVDIHGNLLSFNNALADLLGLSVSEITGRNIRDLVPDKAAAERMKLIRRVQTDKRPVSYEENLFDSTFVHNAYPVFNDQGEVTRIAVYSRDLTKQKKTELAFQQNASRLNSIVHLISDFVYSGTISETGVFRPDWIAGPFSQITGMQTNQVIGHDHGWHRMIVQEDDHTFQRHWDKLLEGNILSTEYRIRCQDHEIRWLRDYVEPIIENGKVVSIIGAVQDITSNRTAQDSILDKNRFIESILNTTPNIIYIHDLRYNRNVFSSQAIHKILGYEPGDLVELGDQVMSHLIHPDDLDRVIQSIGISASLQNGQVHTVEYRMKHKNGNWLWFMNHATPFRRDENNEVIQIIGTAHDITKLKIAEQHLLDLHDQLKEESRMKTGLLNEVSHRVKNNLTSIIGMLYAEKNHFAGEDASSLEKLIERMSHRLECIGEIQSLTLSSQLLQVPLHSIVEAVTGNVLRRLGESGTQTKIDSQRTAEISADQSTALALVLHEVFTMIGKQLGEHAEFRVLTGKRDDTLRIVLPFSLRPDDSSKEMKLHDYLIRNILETELHGTLEIREDQTVIQFPADL